MERRDGSDRAGRCRLDAGRPRGSASGRLPGERRIRQWKTPYVELHCHSAYSFLDGASSSRSSPRAPPSSATRALALTDHDGVYGSLEFAHAAKAFGVRPITGAR